jgi:hypothetical protein
MTKTRTETDTIGPIEVAADRYWGAQTERSRHNFHEQRMPIALIRALAIVKRAAAEVNHALGLLDARRAKAIVRAAQDVIDGNLDAHFSIGRMADRFGHPDQHERQRVDRGARQRDARRQTGRESAFALLLPQTAAARRPGGRALRPNGTDQYPLWPLRLDRQVGVHKQIFQFEQFAQGADGLNGFVLAAHRVKPSIDVSPWRRATEPHGVVNEDACLGERSKPPRLRRVVHDKRRVDAKVVHARRRLAGIPPSALMGVKTRAGGYPIALGLERQPSCRTPWNNAKFCRARRTGR